MSFVEDGGFEPPPDSPANFSPPPSSDEPIRMTLIGSRRAVERMIHLMHKQNIVAGSEWSRPIALKDSREVIRVVSRMITTS
jgi:hypothetical protein